MKIFRLILIINSFSVLRAQNVEIALTFDDFPFVTETPVGYSRIELIKKSPRYFEKTPHWTNRRVR